MQQNVIEARHTPPAAQPRRSPSLSDAAPGGPAGEAELVRVADRFQQLQRTLTALRSIFARSAAVRRGFSASSLRSCGVFFGRAIHARPPAVFGPPAGPGSVQRGACPSLAR